MKNQVKKFSQYIKESNDFEMKGSRRSPKGDAGNGIAVWEIFDYNSVVRFGDDKIMLDDDDSSYDEEGNFIGIDAIFRAAAELGASPHMVWSVEDGKLLYK